MLNRRCYERTRGQLFSILHHKALRRKDKSTLAKAQTNSKKEEEEAEKDNADIGKVLSFSFYILARFSGVFCLYIVKLKF